ncbi:MAG: hypothetical protein IT381_32355 [Deltaproteobacteria bacterium]|nr:hypothetical protein [Deltaproteobacteria bacterium]
MRPVVGIDVGWSKKRRSCAIAASGANIRMRRERAYGNGINAQRATLDELCGALEEWTKRYPEEVAKAVIVLDGPLGRGGPPRADRHIDSACGCDDFNLRAQPVRISHPSTAEYVDATYRVVDALGGSAARDRVWIGGHLPDGTIIAETNPTVGLCLLVAKQDPAKLPSRKRALRIPQRGDSYRAVRAKSDWYWAIGGNAFVADVLGSKEVKEETDHELVAGLYCLAVAQQLAMQAKNKTRAMVLGDEHGGYVVSSMVAQSWFKAVQAVGVIFGQPVCGDDSHYREPLVTRADSVPITFVGKPDDAEGDPSIDRGDFLDLYICDSGGIYAAHNGWLRGEPEPVELSASDGSEILLSHADQNDRSGQWKSMPTTSELGKAFGQAPLSHEHPIVLRVRLK